MLSTLDSNGMITREYMMKCFRKIVTLASYNPSRVSNMVCIRVVTSMCDILKATGFPSVPANNPYTMAQRSNIKHNEVM